MAEFFQVQPALLQLVVVAANTILVEQGFDPFNAVKVGLFSRPAWDRCGKHEQAGEPPTGAEHRQKPTGATEDEPVDHGQNNRFETDPGQAGIQPYTDRQLVNQWISDLVNEK